jgi:uncharacterized protein (DUF58 family)
MIVPTNRLLIFYAITVPALTLLPVLRADAVIPVVAAGLMLALIAVVDGLAAPRRLRGIRVALPGIVRMTRGRQSLLEVSLTHAPANVRSLRLGLPFPEEISSPSEDLSALFPEGADHCRVLWPCTPLKRGPFHIERCYLETMSPLRLWAFRAFRNVSSEIRVYPGLARERKGLAALFLNRGGCGIHARRQFGKGRDFEKLREYIPGDGFNEIHWKATAKRQHPITKVFQIEKTQEIYLVIDASRLSARPAAAREVLLPAPAVSPAFNDSCLERFVAATLVVGLAARKQGDLFGMITFSDSVHAFMRARGTTAHYSACRDRLLSLHPRMVNPDYEELATFIRLKLRRRALILILTSLDDPVHADSFTRAVELICRQHLVMVSMLRPSGARPVFSDPNVSSLDGIYRNLSGHLLWHHLQETEKTLARHGVRFSLLDHERLCPDLLSQYLNVKQRQLL